MQTTDNAQPTATRSPLNNRGYAERRTPGQEAATEGSTPKGVPHQPLLGDPSRVGVRGHVVGSAGRSDLRLLSGEGFTLLQAATAQPFYNF